ncbi:unnamed protein product [Rotaria magnacalcarata]|uniref:SP-RING-type domain-containing protein n=1 Tax=Rotaria magnacalcarata TaxID=392030 RepID=A0A816PJ83_9BILA|nr:unnamed protein product [Rotaria magnacalcarata]
MNPSASSQLKENALDVIRLFRVPDLQAILEYARLSRQGNKRELFERCRIVICSKLTPQLINRINQINLTRINSTRPHYPLISYPVQSEARDYRNQNSIVQPLKPPVEDLPAPDLVQNTDLPFFERIRNIDSINIPVDCFAKVFLRISPTIVSEKQNDVLPPYLFVQLNGHTVINNNIAKTSGSQAHSLLFPTDITDKLILKSSVPSTLHYLWIQLPSSITLRNLPRSYTLKIQLVRHVPLNFLIDNTPDHEPTSQPNHHNDSDIEIEDAGLVATKHRVSLICPITQALIVVPAKSSLCLHLTCFDLRSFLQMNERRLQWMCPLCKKPALYENLRVDKRLQTIILNMPPNCSTVEIDSSSESLSDCYYILDTVKQERSNSALDNSPHQNDHDGEESTQNNTGNKSRRGSVTSDCVVLSSGSESELEENNAQSVNSSLPVTPPTNNLLNQDNLNDERSRTNSTNRPSMSEHSSQSFPGSNVDDESYWDDLAKITRDFPLDNNQENPSRKRSSSSMLSFFSNDDDRRQRKRPRRSPSNKSRPADIEVIVLSSSDSSDNDDHLS